MLSFDTAFAVRGFGRHFLLGVRAWRYLYPKSRSSNGSMAAPGALMRRLVMLLLGCLKDTYFG